MWQWSRDITEELRPFFRPMSFERVFGAPLRAASLITCVCGAQDRGGLNTFLRMYTVVAQITVKSPNSADIIA